MNAVINVYKEKDYTSFDVVAKLRGILRQKKIGHTGTLDPQAEGVLVVCLGNATKLCDMLTEKTKEYEAVMRLGVVTDTQDMTGQILKESEVLVTEQQVKDALFSMVGPSKQIPPMYSALKVNGKKLYELAREGKEVERKARDIEIFDINIKEINLPYVRFVVSCSKGTYVRTICHDIGEKLGCGAAMESLLRTRVERFHLDSALTLSQIEKLRDENRLEEIMIPVDILFDQYPKVVISNDYRKAIDNGNSVFKEMFFKVEEGDLSFEEGDKIRIYNEDDVFYGVYTYIKAEKRYKPYKMFLDHEAIQKYGNHNNN